MKINYFNCKWKFKPEAGYGCNCPENKKGKCIPSNKMPNEEDECDYAVHLNFVIDYKGDTGIYSPEKDVFSCVFEGVEKFRCNDLGKVIEWFLKEEKRRREMDCDYWNKKN